MRRRTGAAVRRPDVSVLVSTRVGGTKAAKDANSADARSVAKVVPCVRNIKLTVRVSETGSCKTGDTHVFARRAKPRQTPRNTPTTPMQLELLVRSVKLTVRVSDKGLTAHYAPEPSR